MEIDSCPTCDDEKKITILDNKKDEWVNLTCPDCTCVHHWVIVPPDGKTWLDGKCKKCGEEKQFRSSPPSQKAYVEKFVIVEESTEDLIEKELKQTDEDEDW